MKRYIVIAIGLLLAAAVSAQDRKLFSGFDGGMMIHTGYLSGPMHLTMKLDWLYPVTKAGLLPNGPRLYFGFLFYH